jgi:hypothetical protein
MSSSSQIQLQSQLYRCIVNVYMCHEKLLAGFFLV